MEFENAPYSWAMARKPRKPRPAQGARLAALRQQAGLTQAELGRLVGEKQQIIAFWEQSDKPPRSDVLPKLARVLGVPVEALLSPSAPVPSLLPRKGGPVGKVRKLFDEVSKLPRRQQDKIVEFLAPIVEQFKRKTG
jgi:transcriptional regulator with XRE-family HTH domain